VPLGITLLPSFFQSSGQLSVISSAKGPPATIISEVVVELPDEPSPDEPYASPYTYILFVSSAKYITSGLILRSELFR
jgi:hypothetical protein